MRMCKKYGFELADFTKQILKSIAFQARRAPNHPRRSKTTD
ncbi:hypothetical protein [Streptococcus intermedius]|nr:hypothetical protein [Streptococcus intermedius]EKU16449.1 hypothetical protein D593_1632 [Streptococcus intermedius BA1]